ncbi:MAG TPA: hypothetical protein VFM19_01985 [Candidatus Limnocylindria bacterium]|nr:hypothetical protein [Candidatus Limnocylindria bacterium]
MIASPPTPPWALALVERVCAEAGAGIPTRLRWARRDRERSSGVTRHATGYVGIVAGSDAEDARQTLLHELAHWIAPPPGRGRRGAKHHDRRFYATAFALYARHGGDPAAALEREAARYPSAIGHARALGIAGADAAWRQRRAALRAARPSRPLRVLVPEHAVRLARDGRWHVCATCGARIVGVTLARLLRARRPTLRHVLLTRR